MTTTHKITTSTATISVENRAGSFHEPVEEVWVTGDRPKMTFVVAHYAEQERYGASLFLYGDRTPRFFVGSEPDLPVSLHMDTPGSSLVIYLHCSAQDLMAALVEAQADAAARSVTA